MKWAAWYVKVDGILLKQQGVRAGNTDIPLRDYWDAGIRPEHVIEQAIQDNYLKPKED